MLLVQLSFLLLVMMAPFKITAVVVGSIAVIIVYLVTANPLTTSIILSVFVAIILPQSFGRALGVKIEEIFPLITVFFLILAYLQKDHTTQSVQPKSIPRVGKMGYWLLVFLFIILISAAKGLLTGRSKMLVFDETMMFAAWGMYFIIVKSQFAQQDIKHLILAIITAAFIVSLYYIYEFIVAGGKSNFRTDQQHILNVSIPILFAILLYDTNRQRKIFSIILMIPMIIAVYITLTRSLWLLIPVSMIWQYLYFIRKEHHQTKFKQVFFPLMITGSVIILGLVLLTQLGIQNLLGERFASFRALQYDLSLLARAELAHYVFGRIRLAPLWGTGLADFLRYQYFPTMGRYNVYWLDSSFLQVLWKTGLIGLTIFSTFMILFISRSFFLLKHAQNIYDKIISSGIFFSMIMLIINGIQSGILVGYRFNFVWAVLFAVIEIRAQQIKAIKKSADSAIKSEITKQQ